MKLVTKFIKKMINHIDDNLVPKEIHPFAKNLFVKQSSGKSTPVHTNHNADQEPQPTASTDGGKRK